MVILKENEKLYSSQFNWFGFRFFDKIIKKEFFSEKRLNSSKNEITGRIYSKDYGDPIPGATVLIEGTTNGADTDEEGYFRLNAKNGDIVKVQYLGFKILKFIVDGTYFNIPLEEEENLLFDEVVIDAYRTTPNYPDAEIYLKNNQMQQILGEHSKIKARKNLKETVFFYPNLYPNKNGEVEIKFKAPEALTKWKLKTLAHDKNGNSNYFAHLAYTQRNVMIQPNMPRFVRETDEVELKARVSNTTDEIFQATALLRLFNTITGEDLTDKIIKSETLIPVVIDAKSSNTVGWKIQVPKNIIGLQYRVSVQAGNFTDGEESVIPVLSNRQLITETLPVWQLANENKTYELTNLINNTSKTLENHQLQIDVSNNATWLMMQSLPYLYNYPYDCSEQLFAKYFANELALHVLETNPLIKKLTEVWKYNPKSKLENNDELNQVISNDLPWMKDLVSNDEKKAQFVSYFNESNLKNESERIKNILFERQSNSGGLPWFDGGKDNLYITNHILITAAHLKKLGIKTSFLDTDIDTKFLNKANQYLDVTFQEKFAKDNQASRFDVIDYAFVKSYFMDLFSISDENKSRIDIRLNELKTDWLTLTLFEKAKLILIAKRNNDIKWAKEIINHLDQSAVLDETYGMFWKENNNTFYYHYNEAEVQALIVEAYKEMEMPEEKIQLLNAWLISRKTQSDWGSTKATTQALYAILLGEQNVNLSKGTINIQVGKENLNTTKNKNLNIEEEVGMFSYRWLGSDIKSEMGKIEIKNSTPKSLFGGIYWQYFEDINEIKNTSVGILNISRTYYIENKDGKWNSIKPETSLVLGQKVKVQIQIEAKRDLSFIHIKDNRPATFEPLDVLAKYYYKDRIYYYQTTKDASTNFFFDYLPKGSYVLEYDVRLNNIGNFTSGISTIQSMYAPQHSSHTTGDKIQVK